MPRGSFQVSDVIAVREIDTGGQKAGNGGDGYFYGEIVNAPKVIFSPYNNAEGADVYVKVGDNVDQKAEWKAGGSNADADGISKAYGGYAESNGSQYSASGHNKSFVDATTTAYQSNFLAVDMDQNVAAGIGGDGGNGNRATGGDVKYTPSIETANLNDVLNGTRFFHIDDFIDV
jgi:hypothetical protein